MSNLANDLFALNDRNERLQEQCDRYKAALEDIADASPHWLPATCARKARKALFPDESEADARKAVRP